MVDYTDVYDVWMEVQLDGDGVALSLIAETDSGSVVQSVDHLYLEDIRTGAGDMFSMRLSDDARDALVRAASRDRSLEEKAAELPDEPSTDELLDYMGLTLSEGDVRRDRDAMQWADNDRVVVTEVTDKTADEYELPDNVWGSTVADANPEFDSSSRVVKVRYLDESGRPDSDEYAMPADRLMRE